MIQTPPMPDSTNASGYACDHGNPPTIDRADDIEGPDAVPVDSAAGHHQQSHVAASSEGQDRGVIESPPMSVATSVATDGLPLRGNVPTSDRSDDTEGPNAVPVDNDDGADNADDNHQQSHVAASRERERERETDRQTDRERETERRREGETDRHSHRQTDRDSETERDRDTERARQRHSRKSIPQPSRNNTRSKGTCTYIYTKLIA